MEDHGTKLDSAKSWVYLINDLSRNNAMNKDKSDTPQSFIILQAVTSSETLKLDVLC